MKPNHLYTLYPFLFLTGSIIAVSALVCYLLTGADYGKTIALIALSNVLIYAGVVMKWKYGRSTSFKESGDPNPNNSAEDAVERSIRELRAYIRELEKVKDKEKVILFALPNGQEVSLQLTYVSNRKVWRVAVPRKPGNWYFYEFADYDRALAFFNYCTDRLSEHFTPLFGEKD